MRLKRHWLRIHVNAEEARNLLILNQIDYKSHVPVSSINASSSGHISYREDTIVANAAATHRIIQGSGARGFRKKTSGLDAVLVGWAIHYIL